MPFQIGLAAKWRYTRYLSTPALHFTLNQHSHQPAPGYDQLSERRINELGDTAKWIWED